MLVSAIRYPAVALRWAPAYLLLCHCGHFIRGPIEQALGGWGKTHRAGHFVYLIIKSLLSVDTLWAFMWAFTWDAGIFKIVPIPREVLHVGVYFFPDIFVTGLLILFLPPP